MVEPFAGGVGPAGAYVVSLDEDRRAQLRDRCRNLLPAAPFVVTARAWALRGARRAPVEDHRGGGRGDHGSPSWRCCSNRGPVRFASLPRTGRRWRRLLPRVRAKPARTRIGFPPTGPAPRPDRVQKSRASTCHASGMPLSTTAHSAGRGRRAGAIARNRSDPHPERRAVRLMTGPPWAPIVGQS